MKKCSKCGQEKPLSEYQKRGDDKTKYRADCKDCVREYKRKINKEGRSNKKQRKDLEHWHEVMNGRELYIALYEMNLAFSYHEFTEIIRLHDEEYTCEDIGRYLKRDPDEVAILKIDLAKKGVI